MSYSAPDVAPSHGPIISTLALESIGDVFSTFRSAPASSTQATANLVRFVPFYITQPIVVVKLLHYNGSTAAGNTDIGIFDANGNRLVAGSNPAQSGTSAWQEHNITDTALNPGRYYVGLKNDGTTGTYMMVGSTSTIYGQLAGVVQAAGAAGGLASSYTFAALSAAKVPMVAMALRTTI
jgi:hypothetical protein